MKVQIITEREFAPEDYWSWVQELHSLGVPLDGEKLLRDGSILFTHREPHTRATTVYRIAKR